jgi:hypothetical protein
VRILLIISFVIVGYYSNAQQFFNNTYDWGAIESGVGMEVIDDTLYTISLTNDFVRRDLILSKFDTNGNKIVDYVIMDSVSLNVGYLGFYVDSDENIIGYGDVNVLDTTRAFVFKIKKTGELVWSNYYGINSLQTVLVGGCLGNDSNYVFAGLQYSVSNGNDFFFLKLDTAGTVVEMKTYGGTGNDKALSIVPGLDSGYLMSGSNTSIEPNGNWHLVKVDESGFVEWERDYGTSFGFEVALIEVGKTGYWGYGAWSTVGSFTGHVTRLNAVGIIQNQIILDQTDIFQANLYAGHELDNGSFVAVGAVLPPFLSDPQGWIIKVDSNCNEIWQRNPDKRLNDHYIYDIEELGDKSLLCIGVVFPDAGLSQDMWLFRTDSFGCIDAGCNSIGLIEKQIENISLSSFPNPFSGNTTIDFNSELEIDEIVVTDILGNRIKEFPVHAKQAQLEIDLSRNTTGIYLCSLFANGQRLKTIKVVLEP